MVDGRRAWPIWRTIRMNERHYGLIKKPVLLLMDESHLAFQPALYDPKQGGDSACMVLWLDLLLFGLYYDRL